MVYGFCVIRSLVMSTHYMLFDYFKPLWYQKTYYIQGEKRQRDEAVNAERELTKNGVVGESYQSHV